jgi:hypothetical protein
MDADIEDPDPEPDWERTWNCLSQDLRDSNVWRWYYFELISKKRFLRIFLNGKAQMRIFYLEAYLPAEALGRYDSADGTVVATAYLPMSDVLLRLRFEPSKTNIRWEEGLIWRHEIAYQFLRFDQVGPDHFPGRFDCPRSVPVLETRRKGIRDKKVSENKCTV